MLRCQFLCYVLKTFCIKIALKISYFCKKCKIFERWGFRPQTQKLAPSSLRMSGYAPGSIFGEELFFGLHLNSGKKKGSIFGEDLFLLFTKFALLKEKWWSRFIPPTLKIGQNWGKIANYPPQCSTKICTPALEHI